MDLHKLRGFYAVAQQGSFTAAARRLRLTQPTISLQVKALEQALRGLSRQISGAETPAAGGGGPE